MHGIFQNFLVFSRIFWNFLEHSRTFFFFFFGILLEFSSAFWNILIFSWNILEFPEFSGTSRNILEFSGIFWFCFIGFFLCVWNFLGYSPEYTGTSRTFLVFSGIFRVFWNLPDFSGIFWNILEFPIHTHIKGRNQEDALLHWTQGSPKPPLWEQGGYFAGKIISFHFVGTSHRVP